MTWKQELRELELSKEWDKAIELMQQVITNNPDNMDAYIYMNFLLMNLLVEEDYNNNNHTYYVTLTKKYFDESYAKFSENTEYLFYTGWTAAMSEWYFGITQEDYERMMNKAMYLEPNHPVYQWNYYVHLKFKFPFNKPQLITYAQLILVEDSPVRTILKEKGALGERFLRIVIYLSESIVGIEPYYGD